jgi:iron-sulfur cluster assembly protein
MDIITFSENAIAHIQTNIEDGGHSKLALRIAAKMSGDEKMQYGIGFDDIKEEDAQFEHKGFKVIISPDCLELLHGTHIDFVAVEDEEQQFIFMNPNDPNYKAPAEDGTET